MSDNTIRDPLNPRRHIVLTAAVVRDLVATARATPAYSASYHVAAMADALEVMTGWALVLAEEVPE